MRHSTRPPRSPQALLRSHTAVHSHAPAKCYLPDLLSLERLGLVAPGSLVLADNVLIPGAPDYLAHVMMPAGGGGAGEATEGGARGTGTSSSGASGDPGALAYQTDLRYTAFEVEERYKKDWQPKRDAMSVSRCVAAA